MVQFSQSDGNGFGAEKSLTIRRKMQMNTGKIEHGRVCMIAHRGLSGLERENTNAAFVAAGNRSYFGIETDVHKTADGQFVIIHDEDTQRVSGGKHCVNVENAPLSASRALVLPDKDGRERGDLCIPTLSEYARICRKYEKISVLELKNPFEEEDIRKIICILREEQQLEHTIFISFVLENCVALRRLLPQQPIQWLLSAPIDEQVVDTLCAYGLGLDVHYKYLTAPIVRMLHAHRIQVNCWTCDDPQQARALVEMGVDQITTNILE